MFEFDQGYSRDNRTPELPLMRSHRIRTASGIGTIWGFYGRSRFRCGSDQIIHIHGSIAPFGNFALPMGGVGWPAAARSPSLRGAGLGEMSHM